MNMNKPRITNNVGFAFIIGVVVAIAFCVIVWVVSTIKADPQPIGYVPEGDVYVIYQYNEEMVVGPLPDTPVSNKIIVEGKDGKDTIVFRMDTEDGPLLCAEEKRECHILTRPKLMKPQMQEMSLPEFPLPMTPIYTE